MSYNTTKLTPEDNININTEVLRKVNQLAKTNPPQTRADYLRLYRAALELLPAIAKK
jgi:hypothetical protein